jgi:hypothetical protein
VYCGTPETFHNVIAELVQRGTFGRGDVLEEIRLRAGTIFKR